MSLRSFGRRKNSASDKSKTDTEMMYLDNEIICDTEELKESIVKWIRIKGWQFEHFANLLKLMGVETPVKCSEWNEEIQSFK